MRRRDGLAFRSPTSGCRAALRREIRVSMAEPTSQTAAVRSCPRVGRSGRSRVVKSGESAPRAVAEFDPKHVGLFDAIRDGYDYALFWTNDDRKSTRLNSSHE